MTAPQSMYAVNILLNGDASGGDAEIILRPDPQFITVVDYVSFGSFNAAANATYVAQIRASGENSGVTKVAQLTGLSAAYPTHTTTWHPPLTLLENQQDPSIRVLTPNVNGVTYALTARLYNYRRVAKHTVPLRILAASFPRAGSLS